MTLEEIEALKLKLHDARVKRDQAIAARVARDADLDRKINTYKQQHKAVYSAEETALEECKTLETALKDAGVDYYKATKEKKPTPGVDVKEYTEYEYDPDKALEWAKSKDMALKLDETAFKDVCKSDTLRPEFVKEHKVPRTSLAKDLSKHIAKEQALPAAA